MGNFCNDTSTVKGRIEQPAEMKSLNLILEEAVFMKLNPNIYEVYRSIYPNMVKKFKEYQKAAAFEVDQYNQRCYVGKSKLRTNLGVMMFNYHRVYYIGYWDDERINGLGIFIDEETGDYYKGDIMKNCPHGYGEYYNKNQNWYYKGQWRHGIRHGQGELRYLSKGVTYVGSFLDDKKHGHGRLQFQTESFYNDSKDTDQINSPGSPKAGKNYSLPKASKLAMAKSPNKMCYYQGKFVEDVAKGRGTQVGVNYKYTGEWQNNMMHGTGRTIYQVISESGQPTIEQYIGQFNKGLKHGYGEYHWRDRKEVYKGIWQNGKIKNQGVFLKPNK